MKSEAMIEEKMLNFSQDTKRPRIIFLTSLDDEACREIRDLFGDCNFNIVRDSVSLKQAKGDILLSFSSSIIVPLDILELYPANAYNIHAASPSYPGRDPHHWAVYDKVTSYGATAHVMTEKVDAGPIVDIELFDVDFKIKPLQLLDLANQAAFRILQRIIPKLIKGARLETLKTAQWGGEKKSRADFMKICSIDSQISKEEFERRYWAFDGENYNNLYTEIHGCRFKIYKHP